MLCHVFARGQERKFMFSMRICLAVGKVAVFSEAVAATQVNPYCVAVSCAPDAFGLNKLAQNWKTLKSKKYMEVKGD